LSSTPGSWLVTVLLTAAAWAFAAGPTAAGALASPAEPAAPACGELSHILVKPGAYGLVYYVELRDCAKLMTYQIVDGKRVDLGTNEIRPEWIERSVDDQYETSHTRNRWVWSSDRQKIIHETVDDSLDKSTGVTTFWARCSVLSRQGAKIRESGFEMRRQQAKDGTVTVESKPIEALHDPISAH